MNEVEKLAKDAIIGALIKAQYPGDIRHRRTCAELILDNINSAGLSLISAEEVERYRWRDIESAPKDGTKILVSGGQWISDSNGWPVDDPRPCDEPEIVAYNSLGLKPFCWRGPNDQAHDEYYWHSPTHWMPLPSPPTQIEGEG